MEGFILLHKSLLNWEWYDEPNVMRLYIHSMLKANYSDANWRGKSLKRGQFISTPKKLGTELNLTVKQIRTALAKLESTGEMASEGTSQHTVFTVKNYDRYQLQGKQRGMPEGEQEASEGQAKGEQEDKQKANERANEGDAQTVENTEENQEMHPQEGEQEANEGQAKKKRKPRKRATANKVNKDIKLLPISDDLVLSDHWRSLAENYWQGKGAMHLCAETEFFKFKNNHRAKGTMSAHWQSNWQTWYVNAVTFSKNAGGSNAQVQSNGTQASAGQYSDQQQRHGKSDGIGGTGDGAWFTEEDLSEIADLYADTDEHDG